MAKRGPRAAAQVSSGSAPSRIRCAIYTRKSTEEGLEQEFNSLDAQHEACAAYVLSQRHEGWSLVPDRYDDGGFSGGTMERPRLKRLLTDVESGKVTVIVVYKVDRLTRALSDFAKIVEVLDARGASFVSITQAFNTTTSMGRLTLNVLLSFAQFEREVTGERIRDKIAASKKKGMWMGGPVPLGYDVVERKLLVNEDEAHTVRHIFERHQALATLQALSKNLAAAGVRSKLRTMRDGRITGGGAYLPGALLHMLRSPLYVGKIRHGDQTYPGIHDAIVTQDVWDRSQALLDRAAPRPLTGHVSLLAGRISDAQGNPLLAAHAIRGQKRYRYYVSRTADAASGENWRLPAGDLEAMVARGVEQFLRDPARIMAQLNNAVASEHLAARGAQLASKAGTASTFMTLLDDMDAAVTVGHDVLEITIKARSFALLLNGWADQNDNDHRISIRLPAMLKRRGHELRLVYPAVHDRPVERDERLIKLVASGWAAWEQLRSGVRIADATRRSHLSRLARLRFLAPDIVTAILDGRQPVELTSRTLLRISEMPLAWSEQRRVLGLA